ncbi:MAG: class I SAM-dependent methyltransferase [Halioglobus sp.]|nr:class I SAM-dependent methyltransferase [Halioglobus sp.]
MSSSDIKSSAIDVGLRDRTMSGWCNDKTGEFVPGVFVKPGMNVVDIGCGDGGYVNFCAKMGANVTFVDMQENKVRALEERVKGFATGEVRGIVSECNPIPIPDGHADLVISTEVLEHVRRPQDFLSEIVRVGREDATWVLTVPDARGENLVKDIAHSAYFEEPNHIQIFSSDDFEALVRSCGLDVVRHEYLAGFWAIFYLLKWATSQPGETLTENVHPATILWTQTWQEVLNHPNGEKMRMALNNALPRCQMIIARRNGAHPG